jgi:outer membrane protein
MVRANAAEDQAAANLRDSELAVREQLVRSLGELRNAELRISVQEASVAAAEEDLSIFRQRYELNASSLLEVLQSQTQLNEARSALIEARFDARTARSRLETLLGRDLGTL